MRNENVKKSLGGYVRLILATIKSAPMRAWRYSVNFFTKPVAMEDHVESERFTKGLGIKNRLKKIRWIRVTIAFVVILLLASTTIFKVFGVTPKPRQTYSNWSWSPPADGFNELEHGLSIDRVTPDAPYFWAHQFGFKGGDGGYIGLQSNGSRVNGTRGKTAVFSVFGSALSGTAGSCILEVKGFDGYNTSGTSCRVPYEWVTGRKYTLRVKLVSSDSTGEWWQAWVKDTFTNTQTSIAKIKTPASWKGINDWSVMWTEYFGIPPTSCDALPYSKVTFFSPIANGGVYKPKSAPVNSFNSGVTCNNSSLANVPGGVSQEVGTKPSLVKNLVYTGNANRVVECAYGAFMNRAPDTSGGTYWRNKYISSNYDLKGLARGLLYSTEGQRVYKNNGFDNFIKRLYTSCLNRSAPDEDIATWRIKLAQGIVPEDIFVFVVNTSGQQLR